MNATDSLTYTNNAKAMTSGEHGNGDTSCNRVHVNTTPLTRNANVTNLYHTPFPGFPFCDPHKCPNNQNSASIVITSQSSPSVNQNQPQPLTHHPKHPNQPQPQPVITNLHQ